MTANASATFHRQLLLRTSDRGCGPSRRERARRLQVERVSLSVLYSNDGELPAIVEIREYPQIPGALLLRLFAANGLRTAAIRRGAWGEGDESATTAAISVGENPKSPWRTLVYDTYHPIRSNLSVRTLPRNSRRP